MRWWIAACAVLVAMAGCLETYSGGSNSRSLSDQYVEARLTWNDGAGGIAWTDEPATEDPGGVPLEEDPARGAKAAAGWNLYTNTGDDHGLIPVDVFESEPVPHTLYVNASNDLHLKVYYTHPGTGKECTTQVYFDVELWLDDRLLAGELHGRPTSFHSGTHCERDFFMPAELDTIPAGSVLSLRVVHHTEEVRWLYGLGEGHWSNLRIPVYDAREVGDRVPEVVAKRAGDSTPAAAGVGLLIVGGWLSTSARRRTAAVALLAVAVALAGCGQAGEGDTAASQGEGEPPRSDATVEVDPRSSSHGNATAAGRLVGAVRDDLGLALKNTYVAILGTSRFAFTDVGGTFEFQGLDPGEYSVRVDKKGFQSLEKPVQVPADSTVRMNITLVPLVQEAPDFRPHQHNLWQGQDTRPLPLVDGGEVVFKHYQGVGDPSPTGVCTYVNVPVFYGYPGYCRVQVAIEPGELVIPGTRSVEVTVSWEEGDGNVDRVALQFLGNKRNPTFSTDAPIMYPRGSGETTRIATNWEMTDVGHQKFSTWSLHLLIPVETGGNGIEPSTVYGAKLVTQPFQVDVTLHRGVLPFEPRHRDFWRGNDTYEITRDDPSQIYCNAGCDYPRTGMWPAYRDPINLTPPQTRWIEAILEVPQPTGVGVGTVQPVDWSLAFRTAEAPRFAIDAADYHRVGPPVSDEDGVKIWHVPVEDDWPDPYYADETFWVWSVDDQQDGLQPYKDYDGASTVLTLIAHRDPMP